MKKYSRSKEVFWDDYILKLVKQLREESNSTHSYVFDKTYRFSKSTFSNLCKVANDFICDKDSNQVSKGVFRFTHFLGEPTIELFFIFDDPHGKKMFPFRIVFIQDGARKYILNGDDISLIFFPAEFDD